MVCNVHKNISLEGEIIMPDRGSKDKGNKEERKKPKLNPKEKKKLKQEKKKITKLPGSIQ